ncbi:periplasmic binding protein [Agromyces rhizosphaerae]|uniref:Periplasmic binding protein n=1 Tax=Agromyces rhizosphaerae TaxID=88374 RepID=A0A9W6FML3_9MICO|nr:iron-siderophore ABC transporter substrate-binding protein [Agromyces rhizosphaerae]GLI26009.1 periplasmic binding protein [Agromyces rhizosphaerae]
MRLRRSLAVAAIAATALALTACASGSGDDTDAADDAAGTGEFPVTLTHALGETEIAEAPERVATWGWGSTEAAIALGVYPVAVAEQPWTVGEDALLPWVEEAYDEAGVEHPAILDDAEGGATVPYEEFVDAAPDLILAPYSGLTQEQYDLLNEIAPVVAYPDAPWTTPWDEEIRIVAEALGRPADGDAVLAGIDEYFATTAEEHPDFAGTTVANVWDGDGFVYVYTAADARVDVLTDIGFEIAPSVTELDTSDGGFYYELSYEELDKLDADVIVSYHSTEDEAAAFLEKSELQAIPAVAAGRVAQVFDPVKVSAVSPPTALSVTWSGGMPELVESLQAALD